VGNGLGGGIVGWAAWVAACWAVDWGIDLGGGGGSLFWPAGRWVRAKLTGQPAWEAENLELFFVFIFVFLFFREREKDESFDILGEKSRTCLRASGIIWCSYTHFIICNKLICPLLIGGQ
jgi:hypothetical protein